MVAEVPQVKPWGEVALGRPAVDEEGVAALGGAGAKRYVPEEAVVEGAVRWDADVVEK